MLYVHFSGVQKNSSTFHSSLDYANKNQLVYSFWASEEKTGGNVSERDVFVDLCN